MARTKHADRILALLNEQPGLDDDQISHILGIYPRQQVNQICRRLESQGLIRREPGPTGKIVNHPGPGQPTPAKPARVPIPPNARRSRSPDVSTVVQPGGENGFLRGDPASTLIVLPCSAAKVRNVLRSERSPSILDHLPQPLAQELALARAQNRSRAAVDESVTIPAWRRYRGTLYESAGRALADAVEDWHILILSGGYGLVLAREPIGWYEAILKSSWWPGCILERALVAYAQRHGLTRVRAFVASSSPYRRIVGRAPWAQAGIRDVLLVMPKTSRGALVKAPRAQGEALAAFLNGRLGPGWCSSDGLPIEFIRP